MANFSPETIASAVHCISEISTDVKVTIANIKAITSSYSDDSVVDTSGLDNLFKEQAMPVITALKDIDSTKDYDDYLEFDDIDMLLDMNDNLHTLSQVDAKLHELVYTLSNTLDIGVNKLYEVFGVDKEHKNKVIVAVESAVSCILARLLDFCNDFLETANSKLESIPVGSKDKNTQTNTNNTTETNTENATTDNAALKTSVFA